jgi:hypothetical protein
MGGSMVSGMDGNMDTGMDLPIKIRTREKLVIYTAWSVEVDTDSKLVEVSGAIKHVPDYEHEDTEPKGLMKKMKETQLMLIGYVQPKDYIDDVVFAPENSLIIIEDTKRTRCGVVGENHAIISDNYVIENVTEIDCPLTKELMETAIHLKALNYRLNAFTYKYDLIILTILLKNNLIQLS